jgi:hypothetical protein
LPDSARQLHDEFDYFSKTFDRYNQTILGGGTVDDYGLDTTVAWSKMSDLEGVKIGAAGPNLPLLDFAVRRRSRPT